MLISAIGFGLNCWQAILVRCWCRSDEFGAESVSGPDCLPLPRLLTSYPGARLAIVGHANDALPAVKATIEEHAVGDRVLLTGMRSDIAAVLAAADLFVSSSRREGVPLAPR